jgi:hypothetical protein
MPPTTITGASGGVSIGSGGILTVTNTGNVYGSGVYGVYANNGAAVTNSGTIGGFNGVVDANGSTVTNNSAGTIAGSSVGVNALGGALINYGSITGPKDGVIANGGSNITNANTGTISSSKFGIATNGSSITNYGLINCSYAGIFTDAARVTNCGTIHGGSYGIFAEFGGTLTNTGFIYGGEGIYAYNSVTITNSGTIAGGTAVQLAKHSTLNVLAGAVFQGAVTDDGTGALTLAGSAAGTLDMGGSFSGFKNISIGTAAWTLEGTTGELANGQVIAGFTLGDAVVLEGFAATYASFTSGSSLVLGNASGTYAINASTSLVTNEALVLSTDGTNSTLAAEIATISNHLSHGVQTNNHTYAASLSITSTGEVKGGSYGIYAIASTLTTSGNISGTTFAVETKQGSSLNVLARAMFMGKVQDDGTGTLNLAGTVAGKLNMGGSFTGFNTISFGSAAWTLEGTASELANSETISGFALHDTIALDGFTATSETYISGTGLELGNGTTEVTLDITGSFSGNPLSFSDTSKGTNITVLCYLHGTHILTPRGERPVESLNIGDTVVTRYNGLQKIKFLGRQSYAAPFLAANRAKWPVRISRGALGDHLPNRDLCVSPGHSMLIGSTLILAENLVNGLTITQPAPAAQIAYIQIELEAHDCVLAEGAWSETFADAPGLRAQFHNAAAFWALYPDYQTPETLQLCAPRPLAGPALEAALHPVISRATANLAPGRLQGNIDALTPTRIAGWAMDFAHPDLPVRLDILLGADIIGTVLACDPRDDLAAAGMGNGNHAFALEISPPLTPAELTTLRIHRTADRTPLPIPRALTRAA